MTERPRFYYGWVLVGLSFIGMVLIYGVRHSFSVFFPPILDEFGWSRGTTAIMLSLNILFYGLVAPFAGNICDFWKPRRTAALGIIFLALSTAGCAFATKLWHFYLLFGILMPAGTAFCGWPILGPTLANWFAQRRGLALGLGQMGGGFSFVYGLFAASVISQLGWRNAYLVLAGILVSIALPMYLIFLRYRPEEKNLKALGQEDMPSKAGTFRADESSPSWTLRNAVRTRQLWLLVVSDLLFWGVGGYMVTAHQVKFAEDVGYGDLFAASVYALFGVFSTMGMFCGFISDRIGRENTVLLASSLSIGALVAILSITDASQPWLLYVFAVCFGLGNGLFAPTVVAGAADIFHGKHFGAIAGLLLTGVGVGGAIGPWLGGYIYDVSGSYTGAFIVAMVCYALSCVAFWLAAPRNTGRMKALRANPHLQC